MSTIQKETAGSNEELKAAAKTLQSLADGKPLIPVGGSKSDQAVLPEQSRTILKEAAETVTAIAHGDTTTDVNPESIKVANAALQAIAQGKDARGVSTDIRYAASASDAAKKVEEETAGAPMIKAGTSTKLHKAVREKDLAGVMLMLPDEQGDVDARDEHGDTPLSLAVALDDSALVAALIGARADVNLRLPNGDTALHIATRTGSSTLTVPTLLLEAKADCNATNDAKDAPLQLAASNGRVDLVSLLLDHGAFRRALTPGKHSALWLAATADTPNKDLITLLAQHGTGEVYEMEMQTGLPLLVKLAELNKLEALDLLLTHGALINGRDTHNKMTALHYASLNGSEHAVRQLLNFGAAPNARDRRNDTPLHLAKTLQIAMLLVVNGARLDLRNDDNVAAGNLHGGQQDSTEYRVLQDARKGWLQQKATVVESDKLVPADWKSTADDTCRLCDQSFGLFHPRHHCQRCGISVCGNCSEMQLCQSNGSSQKNYRCCDSCFLLLNGALKEKLEQRKAQSGVATFLKDEEEAKIASRLKAVGVDEPLTPLETKANESSSIISAASSSTTEKPRTSSEKHEAEPLLSSTSDHSAGSKTESVQAVLEDNKKLLGERGDKLSAVEDKSADLEAHTASFADKARQLREKMEKGF